MERSLINIGGKGTEEMTFRGKKDNYHYAFSRDYRKWSLDSSGFF